MSSGRSEPAAAPAADGWPLLATLGVVIVWGANFTVQKTVFASVGPGGFLFARYLIMPLCALLLLLLASDARAAPARPTRADLIALARLGLIGHAIHVSIVTFGIHWSTAFSSALILSCGPIVTLLILRATGVEQLSRAQVVGVAIALAGVLVFLSEKLVGASWRATGGDLILLFAASLFSYYTVTSKPLIERLGGRTVMIYATLFGCIPVVLLTAPVGLQIAWGSLPWPTWAAIFWSVVVSAFLGWLVWGWVNSVRGVARSAPWMYLMPPVAALISWFGTGEHFTLVKTAGAIITISGVAVAQFARGGAVAARQGEALLD